MHILDRTNTKDTRCQPISKQTCKNQVSEKSREKDFRKTSRIVKTKNIPYSL